MSPELPTNFISPNTDSVRIFIVEGNEEQSHRLKDELKDTFPSLQLIPAKPGTDIIASLTALEPDVVFIDISSEPLSGFDLCRKLKEQPVLNDIPVVFCVTSAESKENRLNAVEAGADGFLTKPAEVYELQLLLKAMLKIGAANKERRFDKKRLEALVENRTKLLAGELDERKKAELKLKESEIKFRSMFEVANVGELIINSSGKVSVNKAFADMLGFTTEELMDKHWRALSFSGDVDLVREKLYPLATGEAISTRFEMRMLSKTNKQLWADISISVIRDDQNKALYYHAATVDITERKLAEEVLRVTANEYRSVVDGLLVGVVVHDKDTRILISNPEASNILGLSAEQMTGKEVMDPAWTFVYPDGTPMKIEDFPVSKVLASKTILTNYLVGLVCSERDYITWANVNAVPIFDSAGALDKIIVNFENITDRINAENKLLESIQFNNSLINSIPFGLNIIDESGTILFASDNLKKELGDIPEPGKCWDLHYKDQFQCPGCPLLTGIEIGKTSTLETDTVKDGETYLITHTGMMFNGKKALLGIYQNITEKKKTQKQVSLLAHSLESISECVSITDTENKIIHVNNAFLRTYGYSLEEVAGSNISMFRAEENEEIETEVLEYTVQGGWRGELINKKKDGTLFPILLSTSVVRDEDGTPIALIGVALDITEIKNTREELILAKEKSERSEEQLRKYFEQNLIGMAITSLEKGWIEVNSAICEFLGYEKEELVQKSWIELTHPEDLDADLEMFTKTIAGEIDGYKIDKRFLHKNGNVVYTELGVRVMRKPDGSVDYFLTLINDISERKHIEVELLKAKEKAEEMNKVKSSFFANMSHELRTPLIGVLGFAELLASELNEQQELEAMASRITKSGQRLLRTLNLILDLSKLEAMEAPPELTPMNIVSELEEITTLFAPAISSKNLQYVFNCESKEIICRINRGFFHSIFNNLINNALRFTTVGTITVTVAQTSDGNYVTIIVADTGEGIPSEKHDVIWQEFRQASEGYSRSHEGTGLGLTLAKRYSELMGGTIKMESTYGEGTAFMVTLPVLINTAYSLPAITPEVDEPKASTVLKPQDRTILYVEDDELAVMIVSLILKNYVKLEVATNSDEALEMAAGKQYDCILMDINLRKGLDGLQTTGIIRKMSGYKDIPIIAVTAYAMESERIEFLSKGFSHYLSKPFTRKELISKLDEIFHS